MAALSQEDEDFLAQCEELFKDRYTDKDEEFMKVHTAEPSSPPIIESWWVPQHGGRRFDRRFNNRRNHPYERQNDQRSGYDNDRRSRYNNDRQDDDRGYGHRNRRYY